MSRRTRGLALGLALAGMGVASAQEVHTYTDNQTGNQRIPLGYPVPMPVASLTPVDGFRDHASLDARLRLLAEDSADLVGHDVGQTANGRVVRAYVVSDGNELDVEGRSEAAFFINASTHAREWATPEVSTYLVERMVQGADDAGLVRYLLDNTRLVIIPVHNIDGLLQTQRFADRAVIGQDPRVPGDWPRDGRMRRKNMPGVDENLLTFADHLRGVDLNRNHPPFWGTVDLGGQLTNPNELTFRGSAPHSEPESQALLTAAELGPPSRFRLGIDVHTFGRVFFSSNTARSRLNQIQSQLLSALSSHHTNVPTAQGAINGAFYRDVPDPPNSGIGAAAEYFAYEWLVPAWTLELEPQNSGAEYGGTGASHSGFILPDSQIRRVREAWAESFLVAFYFMSGPPHLRALRVYDDATGALLQSREWEREAGSGRRTLVSRADAPVLAQRPVRIDLVFSKPMRYRNRDGQIASLPGLSIATLPVLRRLTAGGASETISTVEGSWLNQEGFDRYRDDTFRLLWTPSASGTVDLEVLASDMVGLSLDADPSTPADWQLGAWSEWENASGIDGDSGGADRLTASFSVAETGNPGSVVLQGVPDVVGEGDRLRVQLARSATDASGAVQLSGRVAGGNEISLGWADGDSAERTLALPVDDNTVVDGERAVSWEVFVAGDTQGSPLFSGQVTVLDNDRLAQAVVRSHGDPRADLQLLAESSSAQRDLVIDGGRSYRGPSNLLTVCQQFDMQAPLRVFGNRATLQPGDSSCSLIALRGSGSVELHDLNLDGTREDQSRLPLIAGDEQALSLDRVVMRHAAGFAVATEGAIDARRSAVVDSTIDAAGREGTIGLIETGASLDWSDGSVLDILAAEALTLPARNFRMRGTQESTLRGLSTSGGGADSFSIAGPSLLANGLVLVDPAPVLGPIPICSGVRSGGFNFYLQSGCFTPVATDRSVAVGASSRQGADAAYKPPLAEAIDAGGECGPVDQRGAPRPQTLDEQTAPLCDVGAVELGVNPWRGFWQPTRDGHGIDLQTAGNVLTLLWYTYSEDGQPTAYLASAPLTGPRWQADLLTAVRDPESAQISNPIVGQVSLDFASDVEATLGWQFAGQAPGSEQLRALDFAGAEPRVEVTGSWFPPAESGNGASIARRGEVTAMALYYYDAQGVLRWMLGQGSGADATRVTLSSFTGFCPDCDATTHPVSSVEAGSALLHFRTPLDLVVDSDVVYPGPAGGRWQRSGAAFTPLNDPVDNRDAASLLSR